MLPLYPWKQLMKCSVQCITIEYKTKIKIFHWIWSRTLPDSDAMQTSYNTVSKTILNYLWPKYFFLSDQFVWPLDPKVDKYFLHPMVNLWSLVILNEKGIHSRTWNHFPTSLSTLLVLWSQTWSGLSLFHDKAQYETQWPEVKREITWSMENIFLSKDLIFWSPQTIKAIL